MVVGKHKKFAYRRQENTYLILVIKNLCELPCVSDEMLICKSTGNQEVGRHRKKKTSSKRRKHKFIIIGDSHGR
jgi:hypothetical protein